MNRVCNQGSALRRCSYSLFKQETAPMLDALRERFEVFPVVDAVGGTSVEVHRARLQRVIQTGARPVSRVQMTCVLQRDWSRTTTAAEFAIILCEVE